MAEGRLAFLGDEDVTAAEPAPEPVAQEPEAPVEAPETAPAPITGEDAAPPAAAQEAQERHVPIQVILDERDKRQAAEAAAKEAARELDALRRQLAMVQQQAQRAPEPPIDLIADPDGWQARQQETYRQQLAALELRQTLRTSKFLAEREFGAEEVQAAHAYFDANPALSQQLLQHPSPYHAAVEFYRKQKLAEEIGSDPAAYRAKIEAEMRAKLATDPTFLQAIAGSLNAAPAARPQAPVIPGSLASAPAAGRQEPTNIRDVPARLRGVL
jgi:hypothetical protein